MEPISLVNQISKLIDAHDVPYHLESEWVVPNGELPAIRGTWFPRESSGVLEVEVLIESGVILNECFAGIRAGEEGIADALENFCVNSFHVLLAAFWGVNDPEQVTTEDWVISGKRYTAYIGNFGTRSNTGKTPEIPPGYFESIENLLKSELPTNSVVWLRNFFANVDGNPTYESLLNNEVWEPGLSNLQSLPWQRTEGYYSVRSFLVLRPVV